MTRNQPTPRTGDREIAYTGLHYSLKNLAPLFVKKHVFLVSKILLPITIPGVV